MRLTITVEQFHLNQVLKLIQRTINWHIRVGYSKGSLTPLIIAEYGSGVLVRNININSMSANIQELSNLLHNKYDLYNEAKRDQVIFLDHILSNKNDYQEVKQILETHHSTEVSLKYLEGVT
jgi:hypothetical protein